MPEDIVLPFPSPIAPLRQVRSTVLLSSVASLRDAGHFEAYATRLPVSLHATVIDNIAGVWVPLEAAAAHYRACDELDLTTDAQVKLGQGTWERAKGTLLGTVVRLAKNAGASPSPWQFFAQFQRFWNRGYDGGGVRIVRVGPKDATIEVVECPLITSAYYKNALRGLVTEAINLFCTRGYMRERPTSRKDAVTFHAQWV